MGDCKIQEICTRNAQINDAIERQREALLNCDNYMREIENCSKKIIK